MRRRTAAVTAVGTLLIAAPVIALPVPGLSGEPQLLAAILGQQIKQVASLTQAVTNLTTLVKSMNDVMASAREAVRLVEAIRNFDPNQLLEELKQGVFQGFPEIRDLYIEVEDSWGNAEGILGRESFWDRHSAADDRIRDLTMKMVRLGFRASGKNIIVPMADAIEIDPDETDELIERYYHDARRSAQRAVQRSAWVELTRIGQQMMRDAQRSRNLGDQIDMLGAAAAIESGQKLEALLELQRTERAQEQARRELDRAQGDLLLKALGESGLKPAILE